MELQLKHRVELLLAKERICLERHEQELAVRKACVLYLESVTADSEFKEWTQWRSKMPSLLKWPSWRKSKKRLRIADGDESEPKRRCSTRSKVAGIFTSGATAALIRELFPNQKGVVVSETAPMQEDLMDISLKEVIFSAEWVLEVIVPYNQPVIDSSQEEIVDVTPELILEKELEPEKEEPVASRSRCLRSSAPGRARKKKVTKKRRIRTQDMIEGGTYWSDESAPKSVEVGCLLLGLTQDAIDLY